MEPCKIYNNYEINPNNRIDKNIYYTKTSVHCNVTRQKARHYKSFVIHEYGGFDNAYDAAIEFRDQIVEQYKTKITFINRKYAHYYKK